MPNTTTKPRRARTGNPQDDRAAADAAIAAENAKITPQPEPEPTPEPEPSEPTAQLNIGRFPYWMHRPRITGPDGVEHVCQHRDGHEKIKAAMACARSLGNEFGLTVPAADDSWPEGGPGDPVS